MPAPTGPRATVVHVDARGLTATTGTLAALARLLLAARRTSRRVRLDGAAPPLRALLELVGLDREFEWQSEQREQPGDVQE